MPARQLIEMSQSGIVETIDENSPQIMGDTRIDGLDRGVIRGEIDVKEDLMKNVDVEKIKKSLANPASIDSKKKVRFNPKIVKRRHVSLKDISQAEQENLWYNKKDDKLILAMAKVTVKMIMKGENFDDIDYCSRGLEGKTMSESKKRSRNKRKVLSAVKMEQELQRLEGVRNPAKIANAAKKHTLELSLIAHQKGMEDERAVQEYLSDTRTNSD